jgi:methylmalonyl-CoA/ethylmalonyl-CoA epimerase
MLDVMNFHHVGIACEDIDATAAHYTAMGYTLHPTVVDPLQNIRIAFLTHPSMPCLELLAPVDEKSPVVQILEKNGTTPYHICYTVPDLKDAIKQLKRQRYVVVSSAKPACALEGKEVAFLFHKEVGLIELLQA